MAYLRFLSVPTHGPLLMGGIYRRSELHGRFGGNNTAGIVPSLKEPVVLLFHTRETANQFYGDGFDAQGVYLYSGQGVSGDMDWNRANRATRDHEADGRDLYLFERHQREGGYWQLAHQMVCAGFRKETRLDKAGSPRIAIIFELLPVELDAADEVKNLAENNLEALRQMALGHARESANLTTRTQTVRLRSLAIRKYALLRSKGLCEACETYAPFLDKQSMPFLETHHLRRLADGGPDHPKAVAAVCPNCHRRCHFAIDGEEFNDGLILKIAAKEGRNEPS